MSTPSPLCQAHMPVGAVRQQDWGAAAAAAAAVAPVSATCTPAPALLKRSSSSSRSMPPDGNAEQQEVRL